MVGPVASVVEAASLARDVGADLYLFDVDLADGDGIELGATSPWTGRAGRWSC